MPAAEFFTPLGLYVAHGFLEPDLCARIRNEARAAARTPATIREGGAQYVVDESVRRSAAAEVSDETIDRLQSRLLALKPSLESHFHVTASGCRTPGILAYRVGDYFRPHRDSSSDLDAPRTATGRLVSVVIFLNDESNEPSPETYGGGALTFYGLIPEEPFNRYGFPVTGEAGLLIAFRPDIVHEVTPVTHGERYTVVTWLDA